MSGRSGAPWGASVEAVTDLVVVVLGIVGYAIVTSSFVVRDTFGLQG